MFTLMLNLGLVPMLMLMLVLMLLFGNNPDFDVDADSDYRYPNAREEMCSVGFLLFQFVGAAYPWFWSGVIWIVRSVPHQTGLIIDFDFDFDFEIDFGWQW